MRLVRKSVKCNKVTQLVTNIQTKIYSFLQILNVNGKESGVSKGVFWIKMTIT